MKLSIPTPDTPNSLAEHASLRLMSAVALEKDVATRVKLRVRLYKALSEIAEFDRAQEQIDQALEEMPDHPEALLGKGVALFRDGEFGLGQQFCDQGRWRLKRFAPANRPYPFPLWKGEDIAGKSVLVWAEQGIGDQIMQSRILGELVARGARVTVECEARLHSLLQRQSPDLSLVGGTGGIVPSLLKDKYDYHTSMLSAWRWARFPGTFEPSIKAEEKWVSRFSSDWKSLVGGGSIIKNVGLAWSAKEGARGGNRSLDLATIGLAIADSAKQVRFHSLQYGQPDQAKLGTIFGAPLLVDPRADPLTYLDRAAAQIAALDLVVTIDNTTAHMAGALGMPCWLLLPKSAEYRWGRDPHNTTLYPSIRLFRSRDIGRWDSVLIDLRNALHDWIET